MCSSKGIIIPWTCPCIYTSKSHYVFTSSYYLILLMCPCLFSMAWNPFPWFEACSHSVKPQLNGFVTSSRLPVSFGSLPHPLNTQHSGVFNRSPLLASPGFNDLGLLLGLHLASSPLGFLSLARPCLPSDARFCNPSRLWCSSSPLGSVSIPWCSSLAYGRNPFWLSWCSMILPWVLETKFSHLVIIPSKIHMPYFWDCLSIIWNKDYNFYLPPFSRKTMAPPININLNHGNLDAPSCWGWELPWPTCNA